MITYAPFWETIKKKGVSTYVLINTYHISSSTISRLKLNKNISTSTLNDVCNILDCNVKIINIYKIRMPKSAGARPLL